MLPTLLHPPISAKNSRGRHHSRVMAHLTPGQRGAAAAADTLHDRGEHPRVVSIAARQAWQGTVRLGTAGLSSENRAWRPG